MPTPNEFVFTGEGGFVDTAAPDSMEGYMAPGSEGLYPDGAGMLRSYKDPSSTSKAGSAQGTVIRNAPGGISVSGSVFADRSSPAAGQDKMVYIGNGSVNYDGSVVATASSAITMADLDGTDDFALGLGIPSTPTAVSSSGSGTKMDGSYSVKITFRRTITNGQSQPSLATAPVVVAQGNRLLVTIPARPHASVRYCRIYMTVANFATLGPWFMVRDVDYDAGGFSTSQYIDVYDSDLLAVVPPIGYEDPPAGTHAFRLGGYLCVAGAYPAGGWGIIPSYLNNADAYNPDAVVFLNPGAPITACVGRASDGFQYVACRDSLHACILTGSGEQPILARVLWGQDGFVGPNQMCYVESELWGMSSTRGAVRTTAGGEPDRAFARNVQRTMESLGSSAIVGYDPASNQVVFAAGTTAIAYMRGLEGDRWSAPITLPGTVQSKVTYGGQLRLNLGGTLYTWNAGSPVASTFQPFYRSFNGHEVTLTDAIVKGKEGTTMTLAIQRGMDDSNIYSAVDAGVDSTRFGQWLKLNETRIRAYAPKVGMTGASEIYGVTFRELIHGAYRA